MTGKDKEYYHKYYKNPENKIINSINSTKCQIQKRFNMDYTKYKRLTMQCSVKGCNWRHNIHLHHIDKNKKNNSSDNLIALCPNHHLLIHTKYMGLKLKDLKKYLGKEEYSEEVYDIEFDEESYELLKKWGFLYKNGEENLKKDLPKFLSKLIIRQFKDKK